MDTFDERVGRALTDEDRALLARHGQQGYFAEALGLFRGPMGATMRLVYVVVLASAAGALYALWRLLTATDPLDAVQWGVGTLALLQVTVLCKSYMGSHLEANRVLRELKRLELQMALLRDAPPR